jgi:hypothetical protein
MTDYRHGDTAVESTSKAKKFRSRFRLPKCIFDEIIGKMKTSGVFEARGPGGGPAVPLELKLMAVLRYYATGATWDLIEEAGCFSKTTMSAFEHEFSKWFCDAMYPGLVCPTEPKECEEIYSKLGFPGCLGSMDGVHLAWDRCPQNLVQQFKGKEGYPTVAFNVVADSTRRVQSVTPAFQGTRNDKTMVRADTFVTQLRSDETRTGFTFSLRSDMEDKHKLEDFQGAYVICDGGYHQWRETISGAKSCLCTKLAGLSTLLESQRKEVECMFGILKKRFRILRIPCLFSEAIHIERCFKVCCGLHNMLLAHDGLDKLGTEEDHWKREREADMEILQARADGKVRAYVYDHAMFNEAGRDEFSYAGPLRDDQEREMNVGTFASFREALAQHIWWCKELGLLKWRRTAKELKMGAKHK